MGDGGGEAGLPQGGEEVAVSKAQRGDRESPFQGTKNSPDRLQRREESKASLLSALPLPVPTPVDELHCDTNL